MKHDPKQEQQLMEDLWDPAIADDLVRFVMYVYPWGVKGTPLEHEKGPRQWQLDELREMTAHIRLQKDKNEFGLIPEMWKKATASGRGPGKSALVAWLVHWMMSTRLGSTTIISANTEPQLKSKTFAEIRKWNTLAINSHWFDVSVLAVRPKLWFEEALKSQLKIDTGYYYAQGQLWSEEKPDAYAGAHNPLGLMLLFDEASGIPKAIFDVAEGFFTDISVFRFWNIYSNPRRNSGGFYNAFHIDKKFWRLRQIDSRTVEGLDQARFNEIIAKNGIDDDVTRVEVLGKFPVQGNNQFISSAVAQDAQTRDLEKDNMAPLIMGVDIARQGYAKTVIRFRQGRDARSMPPIRLTKRDNMYVANTIAKLIDERRPDAVNVDAGNGTGVIDRLREMGYKVNEIWFGSSSSSKEWANKRTEMYAWARDWLGGGCIDDDPVLFNDLTAAEYHYFGKAADSVMLESKESMYDRGVGTCDDGDAFALLFAKRVSRRDTRTSRRRSRNRVARDVDYDVI